MKAANSARPSHERALSGQLIHEMLREVYGVLTVVNKAPPKQMLAKFGGSMSIEEFGECSAVQVHQPRDPAAHGRAHLLRGGSRSSRRPRPSRAARRSRTPAPPCSPRK